MPGKVGALQRGQAGVSGVPHWPQKAKPGGLSKWQRLHCIGWFSCTKHLGCMARREQAGKTSLANLPHGAT
jgi:hypothetical protein